MPPLLALPEFHEKISMIQQYNQKLRNDPNEVQKMNELINCELKSVANFLSTKAIPID